MPLWTFFDRTEMPYVVDKNILHRMWCKWMLNVGVNQTLAVYNDAFFVVCTKKAKPEKH